MNSLTACTSYCAAKNETNFIIVAGKICACSSGEKNVCCYNFDISKLKIALSPYMSLANSLGGRVGVKENF
jgi:hypothetical protein